jgi:hypothetical protein
LEQFVLGLYLYGKDEGKNPDHRQQHKAQFPIWFDGRKEVNRKMVAGRGGPVNVECMLCFVMSETW